MQKVGLHRNRRRGRRSLYFRQHLMPSQRQTTTEGGLFRLHYVCIVLQCESKASRYWLEAAHDSSRLICVMETIIFICTVLFL
jgi:hypothetical protein